MTSVLAVFSCSRLERIQAATSARHSDIRSSSCAVIDGIMDDEPVKSKEPACKKGHFIDERHCIICSELLEGSSRGPSVKKPTSDGLRAVLDAACQRKDEVHELLSPVRDDILSFHCRVSFHKSCRAKYTSKTNLQYVGSEPGPSCNVEATATEARRLSRQGTIGFNIREHCFICGFAEKRLPDKCREKLTPISTNTGEPTRTKVMDAAEWRKDEIVRLRMLSYPDLFAFDAKYYRSCYSHYISE